MKPGTTLLAHSHGIWGVLTTAAILTHSALTVTATGGRENMKPMMMMILQDPTEFRVQVGVEWGSNTEGLHLMRKMEQWHNCGT